MGIPESRSGGGDTILRLIGVCVALALANGFALRSDQPKGGDELRDGRITRARRIILIPQENKMVCVARVLDLNDQRFAIGIPECIAKAGGRIVNHTMVEVLHWDGPDANGAVTCQWVDENIDYFVRIVPDYDSVDITMTIRNLTGRDWVDVYSFNCLNPVAAPDYKDWTLERTYMSKDGSRFRMDGTTRPGAAMDSSGNLVLAGSVHEKQGALSPPTGSLVFKEPAGEVVGYISASGDLFLKGEVFGGT